MIVRLDTTAITRDPECKGTVWQALAREVREHAVYDFSVGDANQRALSSAIRVEGPISDSF
jgi:hypothetical protein